MRSEHYLCEKDETQTRSLTLYPKHQPQVRLEVFPNHPLPDQEPDYFQEQLERFAGNIRGQCSVAVNGRSGAATVHLIEELYRQRQQLEEPWLLYRKNRKTRVET